MNSVIIRAFLLYSTLYHVASDEVQATPRFTNEDDCGVSVISRSGAISRVVNGTASAQGQWPWQAAIVLSSGGSLSVICGGSVINNKWVVTAAHCFNNEPLSDISVFLGMNDKSNGNEANRQILQLESKTCHPNYTGNGNFANDICLLSLTSDVSYTTYIRPICLPNQGSSESVGQSCIVSGWGETENTGNNNILQYAEVSIIDHTLCSGWYQAVGLSIPENHICAGYELGGTDTCQGDSGGPLVCQQTVSGSTSYILQGITSFGSGCAEVRRPGVYTKVSEYIDWIDEVVGSSATSIERNSWALVFLCFQCCFCGIQAVY
uniref:plasma kallikrein-like n=1 Tax=Styela clava TaxID=7725 RepID=UPI00193939D4|nr:plasma kallikrein-like [Styela clava]